MEDEKDVDFANVNIKVRRAVDSPRSLVVYCVVPFPSYSQTFLVEQIVNRKRMARHYTDLELELELKFQYPIPTAHRHLPTFLTFPRPALPIQRTLCV